MRKCILILSCVLATVFTALAQEDGFQWKRTMMDASRTGVTAPSQDNVAEALGTVRGNTYTAPNGRVYRGGATVKVAATVIAAQETMAPVKRVIAHAPEAMETHAPESPLSNWFADIMIPITENLYGRHVDISVGNFGGIRVNMPQGDVTVDDIRSMFPFRNDVVFVALKGSEIRALLEGMAARRRFEVLGGVRVVAKDSTLVAATVGGIPLDDEKVYGVGTISFLLSGGDGLFLGNNAVEILDNGTDIYTAVMDYIEAETAAGRPLTGSVDGRIKYLDDRKLWR